MRIASLLSALLLFPAPAAAVEWAVGDKTLPQQDALSRSVTDAIGKHGPRGPALKPGVEALFLVSCSDAGCTPELISSTALPADTDLIVAWSKRWILPVTTPGLAMPARVWWEKPRKDEKKEKLVGDALPTRPPPGLRWSVGPIPKASGALSLEEVLRAERLVFSAAATICKAEVAALRPGTGATSHWHIDIAESGSVTATPQDLYVPPPDPEAAKAKKAGEGGAAAAAALGLEAPVAVPAPVAEAEVLPPRALTALETCVSFNLGQARFKGDSKAVSAVDWLPVTVVP